MTEIPLRKIFPTHKLFIVLFMITPNNPNSFESLIVPWNIWVRTPHRSWFGTKIKLELDLLERGNDSSGTLNSDSGTQKQQTNNFARQKMLCFFVYYYVNVSTKKTWYVAPMMTDE